MDTKSKLFWLRFDDDHESAYRDIINLIRTGRPDARTLEGRDVPDWLILLCQARRTFDLPERFRLVEAAGRRARPVINSLTMEIWMSRNSDDDAERAGCVERIERLFADYIDDPGTPEKRNLELCIEALRNYAMFGPGVTETSLALGSKTDRHLRAGG